MFPVVIIPGLCGSALSDKDGKWVWSSQDPNFDWVSAMGAHYDSETNTVVSNSEVNVVPGKEGVSQLVAPPYPSVYMNELIKGLTPSGVDAAPYDWRLVPQQAALDSWVADLKKRVGNLRNHNDQKKVFIVAHSMGNMMSMYLFHAEPQWVKENIQGYIAVCPAHGGAGVMVLSMIKFLPLALPTSDGQVAVVICPGEVARGFPSFGWLFPSPDVFGDATVLEYDGKSYNSHQFIHEFLPKKYPDAYKIYTKITEPKLQFMRSKPPVDSYLIVSEVSDQGTTLGIKYNSATDLFTEIKETERPFGDGALTHKSMTINTWWNETISLPDMSHIEIVQKPLFIQKVKEILANAAAKK